MDLNRPYGRLEAVPTREKQQMTGCIGGIALGLFFAGFIFLVASLFVRIDRIEKVMGLPACRFIGITFTCDLF